MLEQDIGCDSVEVQQTRVQLTRIVMTADNEQTRSDASRRLIELTNRRCTPLSGIYPVTGQVSGLLKVTTKDGAELWLVE